MLKTHPRSETEALARGAELWLVAAAPELAAAAAGLARWVLPPTVPVRAAAVGNPVSLARGPAVPGLGHPQATVDRFSGMPRSALVCALDPAAWDVLARAVPEPSASCSGWLPADGQDAGGAAHLDALAAHLLARAEDLAARALLAAPGARAPTVAVIGGSGFYDLPGLSGDVEIEVQTPYGPPSARLREGRLGGVRVLFLPRHGRGHGLLPHEVNVRANVAALKWAGATHVVSVSAVGSLREEIAPGHVIVPAQFIDRTVARPMTFFGEGAVAHASLADPVCAPLAAGLAAAARSVGATVHAGTTYLCMEGPQFSTRAESNLYRSWGCDVIGMTNLPEARLCREAELCYATLALATDYDSWREDAEAVQAHDVLAVLRDSVALARRVLVEAVTVPPGALGVSGGCPDCAALDGAVFTPPEAIPLPARVRLAPILTPWLVRRRGRPA